MNYKIESGSAKDDHSVLVCILMINSITHFGFSMTPKSNPFMVGILVRDSPDEMSWAKGAPPNLRDAIGDYLLERNQDSGIWIWVNLFEINPLIVT